MAYEDPKQMGPEIARNMPGVGLLISVYQALNNLNQKMPSSGADVMKLLGAPTAPTYRNDQPLPRHGGFDANGQPIIVPPQNRFYPGR